MRFHSQYFIIPRSLLIVALSISTSAPALAAGVVPCDPPKLLKEVVPEAAGHSRNASTGYRGIRNIRFEAHAGNSAESIELAQNYLHLLEHPQHLKVIPESDSVTRLKPLMDLPAKYVATIDEKDSQYLLIKAEGEFPKFGDYRYVDLPNGTRYHHTENGVTTHFISPRGIREGFTVRVNLKNGDISTEKYISDQLQFRVTYDADGNILTSEPVKPLVVSTSDDIIVKNKEDSVVEDGRVLEVVPGKKILMATVIADHANTPGILNYRNGFSELKWDPEAKVYQPTYDAEGKIVWHYISPIGSDFKNGLVLSTGRGKEIVVLYRPNSSKAIGKAIPKGYSIQRLSFPDYETYLKYDPAHLYEDLEHPEKLAGLNRVHPTEAGQVLNAEEVNDPYLKQKNVFKNGFGGGAKPAGVSMDANGGVYLQETFGAPKVKIDQISKKDIKNYVLSSGETNWLFPGHGLRYSRDQIAKRAAGQFENGVQFRDYDSLVWLTDGGMKNVKRIRPGFMGPTTIFDQGQYSSIADLRTHAGYITGTEVMPDGMLHITYGSSDHNTGLAKIDVAKLLRDMSRKSSEAQEGLMLAAPFGAVQAIAHPSAPDQKDSP
jgi:hypothetical protein